MGVWVDSGVFCESTEVEGSTLSKEKSTKVNSCFTAQ